MSKEIKILLAEKNSAEFERLKHILEPHGYSVVVDSEEVSGKQVLGAASEEVVERKRAEQRLAMQHKITRVLAEFDLINDAVPQILRAVCENLGWDLGEFWRVDKEENKIRCDEIWHTENIAAAESTLCSREKFDIGEGLPGQVWETENPLWIADISQDKIFVRRTQFISCGLYAAFGFPVRLGGEVLGVVKTPNLEPLV